jgi:hypothetical protein
MTVIIVRAKIPFTEAPHGCGAAIKKTFVDGNRSRFSGATACQ